MGKALSRSVREKARYNRWRFKVLELLGNECAHCAEKDLRVMQVDHVRGGGTRERKKISRGRSGTYFKFVLTDAMRHPGKYQLLCANCNWIKKLERNET